MALDIDGYAVLGAIARQPNAFPAIRNDVSKVARTLVVKQLKEKATSIETVRHIAKAVDVDAFDLILDLMTDAEIKGLVGKVDKLNADAKTESPQWQRGHVSELAHGKKEPAAKKSVAKSAKPKKETPKVERAGSAQFSKVKKKVV